MLDNLDHHMFLYPHSYNEDGAIDTNNFQSKCCYFLVLILYFKTKQNITSYRLGEEN